MKSYDFSTPGHQTYTVEPRHNLIPQCHFCDEQTTIVFNSNDYWTWTHDHPHVQVLFPHVPAEQRELLITGTHPECWDNLFAEEEEIEDKEVFMTPETAPSYFFPAQQDLYDVVSFEGFDYSNYIQGEQEILIPQLEKLGYHSFFTTMGERDSFGPLTRVITCTDSETNTQVQFIYG